MAAPALFTLPNNADIRAAEPARARVLESNMALAEILPLEDVNADMLHWEIRDDLRGLTPALGPNDVYPVTLDANAKRFSFAPGRFGERQNLEAEKIERLRQLGTFGTPINVSQEIARMLEDMAQRGAITREYMRAQLLINGYVLVSKVTGGTIKIGSFTPVSYTAGTLWSDLANATPLANLRTWCNANRGKGFDFRGGRLFANAITIDYLLGNRNAADIGGKRMDGLRQPLGLTDVNSVFALENLPTIRQYDETYLDSTGTVVPFIPDGKILLVGARPGTGIKIGSWALTRNAALMGAPGIYATTGLNEEEPKMPYAAYGFNGGPVPTYLSQTIVLTVA